MFENIYLSYYFLVRSDKHLGKEGRVRFLIESVLFMLNTSILLVSFGVLNIRTDNLVIIAVLLSISFFNAYWMTKLIVTKGKEQKYIKSGKHYDLQKKKKYATIGLLWFLFSFILLVFSAILMSYLWSLELF